MSKSRATGCTRFIVAMMVIIPLAYFASMMITGETVNFKALLNRWLGNKIEVKDARPERNDKTVSYKDKLNEKKSSSGALKNIGDFKDRIKTLEAQVKDKDEKIEYLFKQLQKSERELEAAKKKLSGN